MRNYLKPAAATCLAATLMTGPLTSPLLAQAATEQATTTKVSFIAQAKSAKTPIYDKAGDKKVKTLAGTEYTNEMFYVRTKTVVAGTTYYQITRSASDTATAIGWVKEKSLKLAAFSYMKNDATAKTLNGTGIAYTRPGGQARNIMFKNLSAYKNKTFTPQSTAKVGNEIWYLGKVDTYTVWIKAASVGTVEASKPEDKPAVKAEAVSYVANAKSAKTPIYKEAGDKKSLMLAGKTYTNETFYVYQKKVINDIAYFEITRKKDGEAIGWVKEKSLKLQTLKIMPNSKKTFYIKGTGKGYTRPAGASRNVLYKSLAAYKDTSFKPTSKVKVGTKNWYTAKIGGNTVWLKSSDITTKKPVPPTPEEPDTVVIVEEAIEAVASITKSTAKAIPSLKQPTKTVAIDAEDINVTQFIDKKATIGDAVYYEFADIGFVAEADVKVASYTNEQNLNDTRTLKGTGRGYSVPGASRAGEAVLSTLAALANTDFKVERSALVDGKLWYYGSTVNDVDIWTAATNTTDKKAPEPVKPTYTNVNLQASIVSGTVPIYADVENLASVRNLSAAEKAQRYAALRKAVTADGAVYYELSYNGEVSGWVSSKYLTFEEEPTTEVASLFLTGQGKAYSEAGNKGTVIYSSLDAYRTEGFIPKTSRTINNVIYYNGTLGGKTVWISSAHLANPFYVENLRKTSTITKAEMEAYLVKKKGTAIQSNALYKAIPTFLAVQEKYGINAQFMLAHAIWETGWGSSEILYYKNNAFGYQAYDSCAKTCAIYFPTMNDGVEYYADQIYNKYLKDGAIYNNGTTPAGMNVKYATDKNWGGSIARLMNEMKAYDRTYYDKKAASTNEPARITAQYDHIIPMSQPQPASFRTITGTATVTTATKLYNMPYVNSTREMATAKVGDKLNIVAYHEDVRDTTASRWFRIDYNGTQAWVQSANLSIPSIASAVKDNTVIWSEAGTPAALSIGTLSKNAHINVILDENGNTIKSKDTSGASYISVQVPNSTKVGWIKETELRLF